MKIFILKSLVVFCAAAAFMTFFYPKYELKVRYSSKDGSVYHVQHNKITGSLKRLGSNSY